MGLKKFKFTIEIEINASNQTIANNQLHNKLKKFNQPYMTNYRVIKTEIVQQ